MKTGTKFALIGTIAGIIYGFLLLFLSSYFTSTQGGIIYGFLVAPLTFIGKFLRFIGILDTYEAMWASLILGPITYGIIGGITGIIIFFLVKKYRHKKDLMILMIVLMILITSNYSSAYKIEDNSEVHQKITKESLEIWKFTPKEIKDFANNSIQTGIDPLDPQPFTRNYNSGDDIITGSAEEDIFPSFFEHFFQPDNPNTASVGTDDYNDGIGPFGSSYRRGLNMLKDNFIKNYLKGNKEEAWYYAGRIAHLLEDASQPSHVHLDLHLPGPDNSSLEEYTAQPSYFQSLDGSLFAGKEYKYERLIPNFDWKKVQPINAESGKNQLPFFKLFWYTAQKTQYFASDDVERDFTYKEIGLFPPTHNWDSSGPGSLNLWAPEGLTSTSNFTTRSQLPSQVAKEANAVVPHAMKSVAGLYRLLWDYANSDWKTFQHDNQRSGHNILQGDLRPGSVDYLNLSLLSNVTQDHVSRPLTADIDNNGRQDVIITAQEAIGASSNWIFDSEYNGRSMELKWVISIPPSNGVPAVANVDSDPSLEIVFGIQAGWLLQIDLYPRWLTGYINHFFRVDEKYSPLAAGYYRGSISDILIDDLDLDGTPEIVFSDYVDSSIYDWPGELYVMEPNFGSFDPSKIIDKIQFQDGAAGQNAAPAVANIDGDPNLEIIASSYKKVEVFDFNRRSLTRKWTREMPKITGSPVILDIDEDNKLEIVISSNILNCPSAYTCNDKTYILDAETGNIENSFTHAFKSMITPVIANIDSDPAKEIIMAVRNSASPLIYSGKIIALDSSTGSVDWTYDDAGRLQTSFVSPSLADITGDGNLDIIFSAYNDNNVYILNSNGSLNFKFPVSGIIGSSVVISDIDGDGVAELAVKREGSSVFSMITGNNTMPKFNYNISDINAREGDLIDLNASGEIVATDPDGTPITYIFDYPFNETKGIWQTDCNSAGHYNIFVEVSDGNLSDLQSVNVFINESCTPTYNLAVQNLADLTPNSSNKTFEFTIKNLGRDMIPGPINWSFNTNDGYITNSSQSIYYLQPNGTINVVVSHNYFISLPNWRTVNASANAANTSDSETLTFQLLSASYGRITDAISGSAIQSARVNSGSAGPVMSNASGDYNLTGLPPGLNILNYVHPQYYANPNSIRIAVPPNVNQNLLMADYAAPIISNLSVHSISYNSAIISWADTDWSNTSVILDDYQIRSQNQTDPVTEWHNPQFSPPKAIHNISMTGLFNDTNYRFNIKSCNPIGNCTTQGIYNFTTS